MSKKSKRTDEYVAVHRLWLGDERGYCEPGERPDLGHLSDAQIARLRSVGAIVPCDHCEEPSPLPVEPAVVGEE